MLAKVKEKISSLIKKGKNVYKPHRFDRDLQLNHIYTDKFSNRYYEIENFMDMNNSRAMQAGSYIAMAEYCLTKEDGNLIFDKMEEYGNKGDIVTLFALLKELRFRWNSTAEEKTLLNLASVYFIDEYEDINDFNAYEQNRKIKNWESDDKAKSFFLHAAFRLTKNFMNISETDTPRYLQMLRSKEPMISSLLQKDSTAI